MSKNLGLPTRTENYSEWYNELVFRAGLAEHGPARGSMILKPHGFAIWEFMQRALDDMIKATGHQNAYFPLLIPESFMTKEAQHVEGFAPECAVVTHGGGKKLEEPLYIRPTSETVIWNAYSRWIQSYRDLPVLMNQWCNVMRWEMRTRMFLRTTEILWQEGHTAHATAEEAEAETRLMLECYRKFGEDWLAIPFLTGVKTENEKFPGAVRTYTIEALTQDLRALQAGTSHNLGENFSKAFDVMYLDQQGQRQYPHGTSWGVTTRLVGAMIMTHSDDNGLVLPPRVAPIQVVIVPVGLKADNKDQLFDKSAELSTLLKQKAIYNTSLRVHIDKREKESTGFKFNDWELKGACIRVEIGPRDLEQNQCVIALRDNKEKLTLSLDHLAEEVESQLTIMQQRLYDNAVKFRELHTYEVNTWEEFEQKFKGEGGAGFISAYWDGTTETEKAINEQTKATIRCIPLSLQNPKEGKCIYTGKWSKQRVIFAKSY